MIIFILCSLLSIVDNGMINIITKFKKAKKMELITKLS